MAEQDQKLPREQMGGGGGVLLVVSDVPEAEEKDSGKESDQKVPILVPEPDDLAMPDEPEKTGDEACNFESNEEQTKAIDLPENEKKALQELKHLLQDALDRHEFEASAGAEKKTTPEAKSVSETEKDSALDPPVQTIAEALLEDDGAKTLEAIEETIVAAVRSKEKPEETIVSQKVSIWGIKLLEDDRSDVILLKFLQAREFKAKEAFTMIKNTITWRREFGIDELVEEDLGCRDLERVVYTYGHSREGHPVCYNVYGEFQDKELYQNTFSDELKRQRFLRWRIQFLERSIRKLDFRPGGISTIVQVNDLKNSPGPNRWELRQATNQALHLLQDNYPEFVAKQIFINVPWWYLALSKMISPFLTQRTKSKFVVAGPSKSTETLLKYVCGEQIPTQYGGLSNGGNFGTDDTVSEVIVKPSAKHVVEFSVDEECIVRWEVRVVGWEVSYGAEFVPNAETGYTVIIQKMKKIPNSSSSGDEDRVEMVSCSYRVGEPGKVVLAINNPTSRKKKLLYRFKTNPNSADVVD
ncbi:patellin-3-like [Andrographis paniculata]|uniref:patellin-3-like n=1 Tax=Andrographis paniculata TaxID=175694 RepID=UPI0021E8B5C2|nr:patellin-3-like [Andrographis paniculata]